MALTEIDRIGIRISLPEWVTDREWRYEGVRYFPADHVWAGQLDLVSEGDYISDYFMTIFDSISEYDSHPWGPSLTVEFSDMESLKAFPKLHRKVDRELERIASLDSSKRAKLRRDYAIQRKCSTFEIFFVEDNTSDDE